MPIKVYNTLTQRIEDLVPLRGPRLNMFVCGPTVYDYAHLGHAKTYTQFDFIARYLRYRGFDVFYLQNITDIDDKIIQRAKEKDVPPDALAQQYEKSYRQDMDALHNRAVSKYAPATEFIPNIVSQIKRLIEREYAYRISDGYYFATDRFPGYGKLSGRINVQLTDAISRIDENPEKRSTRDFCLWKFRKPGEPFWISEIGEGRPGWHIEDTAISEAFFGPQYDLHGGAIDLIFPHHEAEIAQMEASFGVNPMVKYWLHTGFLNINAEKMSKSVGNFLTIRDVLASASYRTLRFFFLSHHYRTSINLTEDSLKQAQGALDRLDNFVRLIDRTWNDANNESIIVELRRDFFAHLDNDFDTPAAMASLFDFVRAANKTGRAGQRVFSFLAEVNEIVDFLNLSEQQPLLVPEVERLIAERQELRERGKYAEADLIRKRLKEHGIILEDSSSGVKWRADHQATNYSA